METGAVSEKIKRGRHTTRHSELFYLEEDTFLMDTPGFTSLNVEGIECQELKHYFPEFAPYLDGCRFVGCQHVKEKGCAVLQAVKDGKIPVSRHRSYVRLYEELKPLKEWEQKQP